MSPERQNRAIARILGWTSLPPFKGEDPRWARIIRKNLTQFMMKPDSVTMAYIPNYYGDLNLIHAAMETKNEEISVVPDFYYDLQDIIARDRGVALKRDLLGFSGWIAFATAPQLCEAFLKFFGEWEEED